MNHAPLSRWLQIHDPPDPALELALEQILAEARAAWPAIPLEPERFLPYLAQRLDPTQAPLPALRALHAPDLLLACGCALGLPEAISAFERELTALLPQALSTLQPTPAFTDEVGQLLRGRLLLSEADAAPRITEYSGRGSLRGFLRIAALRTGRDLLRRQSARRGAEQAAAQEPPPLTSSAPEDQLLRDRYQQGFQAALAEALAALPAPQRELLQLHFLQGEKLESIGARLGVNKSTVSRRIAAACDAVMAAAQARMQAQLGINPAEFESLAGVLRSQLHISLSRVLRLPLGPAGPTGL